MTQVQLFAQIPNPIDGTSFYRAMGVFPDLKDKIPELNIIQNPQSWDWSCLGFADAVFLQRPFTDQHLQIADMVHQNCIPLWIDYDDDLFCVPKPNPTYPIYNNPKSQENITKILARADMVTVSTQILKRKLSAITGGSAKPEIIVVPNAFNDRKVNCRPQLNPPKKLINWRGSPTHEKDVAVYSDAIVKLAHEFPDWTWNFIGQSWWGLTERMPRKNLCECPAVDQTTYWHLLGQLQPAIQIVPLDECEFNRSKSNIGWIEGAYSGAACLAPDWEEWEQPGIIRYKDPQHFYGSLKAMMMEPWLLRKIGEEGWQAVQEKFMLSKVNELRRDVLMDLIKVKKPFVSIPLLGFSQPPQPSSSEPSTDSQELMAASG